MADMIKCPACSRRVTEITQYMLSYLDKNFHCKCGYKGRLYWERTKDESK